MFGREFRKKIILYLTIGASLGFLLITNDYLEKRALAKKAESKAVVCKGKRGKELVECMDGERIDYQKLLSERSRSRY